MKLILFIVCCVLAILKQNVDGAAIVKKHTKPVHDIESEEKDNEIVSLIDSIEKEGDVKDDFNVSFMKKRPVQKKIVSIQKKKKVNTANKKRSTKPTDQKKQIKRRKQSRKDILLKSTPAALKSGIQDRKASQDIGLIRRTLGGSVEDETVEDRADVHGRRTVDAPRTRKFEDVYRYENEPLKHMLLWLVVNGVNPSIKNAVKASKIAVDRYVKHSVDKAGAQAALGYTDYTSLRFDKDRIMMYCGGQMYVYNTLKDSKICYNGQVYEVRLI